MPTTIKWGMSMWLLATYVGLTFVGTAVIYFLGLAVEQTWPAASLRSFS